MGVAAALLSVAAVAPAATRRSRAGARQVALCALPSKPTSSLQELMDLASEVLAAEKSKFDDALAQGLVVRLSVLASSELARGGAVAAAASQAIAEAGDVLRASAEGRLRWVATTCASMLFAYAVTLSPANALDQVNYTDFLDQVKRGDVEMVRVGADMLTAQYTNKDGARHEVNLLPNKMVDDALFDQLTAQKVDVVMQNANAQSGGPFDFLAKYAGSIAWLIAGLLCALAAWEVQLAWVVVQTPSSWASRRENR